MAYDRHLLYHSLRISTDPRWASAYRSPRRLGRGLSQSPAEECETQMDDQASVIPLFGDHEHSSHG